MFQYVDQQQESFILLGEYLELQPLPLRSLTMPQHNLEQLSLNELRDYVLAHRGDNQALRYYMDRLRDDPNSRGPDELIKLEQLFQKKSNP